MKAVIVSAKDAVLKDVPVPEPGDDEILVKSERRPSETLPCSLT
jgi:NADPH:quinone reductase-like Zn-dependent oxidoreductase